MGWKSTMDITREDCLREIKARLDSATDAALETALDDLVNHNGDNDTPPWCKSLYGYNFKIVPGYTTDPDWRSRQYRVPLGDLED